MPFNVGPLELIIVLAIALLVIGPRRLPEMGNAVGKTIREFRKASSEMTEATSLDPATKPAPAAQPPSAAAPEPPADPEPPATSPPVAPERKSDDA
jgi:TatA/E family protein of Tat protein translocase